MIHEPIDANNESVADFQEATKLFLRGKYVPPKRIHITQRLLLTNPNQTIGLLRTLLFMLTLLNNTFFQYKGWLYGRLGTLLSISLYHRDAIEARAAGKHEFAMRNLQK